MQVTKRIFAVLTVFVTLITACNPPQQDSEQELSIDFEKYTLSNGLNVILHQDKSDPIVAVAILIHAGSNREKPGRTGFASLFRAHAFSTF